MRSVLWNLLTLLDNGHCFVEFMKFDFSFKIGTIYTNHLGQVKGNNEVNFIR